jgi:site-specific recombinase XerD
MAIKKSANTQGTAAKLPPYKYLKKEQIEKLRGYFADKKAGRPQNKLPIRLATNEMVFDLLLNTGLQVAELCNLQLRDLPRCHGKLIIDVRVGHIPREVVISRDLADRLQSFTKRFHKHSKPQYFLFFSENYGPISTASLRSRLKRLGKAADIGNLYPRLLRYTYATHLYESCKDLLFVQKQLGQKTFKIGILSKAAEDDLRQRYVNEFYL